MMVVDMCVMWWGNAIVSKQSMAADMEASGRIFGFVTTAVTMCDALLLMGLSAIFTAVDLQYGLWISCGFIAVHGLVELIIGPSLVLGDVDEKEEKDASGLPHATNSMLN